MRIHNITRCRKMTTPLPKVRPQRHICMHVPLSTLLLLMPDEERDLDIPMTQSAAFYKQQPVSLERSMGA